jgi:imidazolonepropionase-like amidohydrolase
MRTFIPHVAMRQLRQLVLLPLFLVPPDAAASQRWRAPNRSMAAADSGSLVIHLLERPVGSERYQVQREGQDWLLSSTLDFVDRGSRVQLDARLQTRADFTPTSFHAKGKTYRFVNVDVDVDVVGGTTRTRNLGDTTTIPTPPLFFTTRGYAPLAGRAMLIRYWDAHSRPAQIANVPGSGDAQIAIAYRGTDTIRVAGTIAALRRYVVDGVVWGREAVWLDQHGNLAALITRVHILPLEAVRSDLDQALPQFQASALRDRMNDVVRMAREVPPLAAGTFALVGGRVIDGTDRAPVGDATVVIRAGRIAAVGARGSVSIPAGAKVFDARGKTILPGLWDMHGHVSQIEWGPAYLAAGVTSVRDMGGEARFLNALRDTFGAVGGPGPRLFLAGLIDGPGPNGFGTVIASTPEEGRTLVDSYHARGFEQIKLYGSILAPVAGAVIRRAHEVGMTVTGHVPVTMGLTAIVDSGMDNVAHLPFRGDESPNDLTQLIQLLATKRTVTDPTVAWNELLGRAPSTAVSAFEPGINEAPPPLALNYASVRNSIDSAGASAARARGIAAMKALHDAGVPIVAGTDGGVPGYSLLREVELSVAAGLTPLEAIQTATIVPARVMGMERDVGTIEAGKVADLLVLDADPLANIANIRRAAWVVRAGRMYETQRLWRVAGFVAGRN